MAIRRRNPGWTDRLLGLSVGKVVAVGYPKGKANAYPDGTPVMLVAAVHNYGMGQPKRPFMDQAAVEMQAGFQDLARKAAPKIIEGRLDVETVLKAAGLMGERNVVEAIDKGGFIPNNAETIERKGSDKPLIDTGHLRAAVTSVVRGRRS